MFVVQSQLKISLLRLVLRSLIFEIDDLSFVSEVSKFIELKTFFSQSQIPFRVYQ